MSSAREPMVATVTSVRPVTPRMVRIEMQADRFRDLPVGDFTDHYVKLQLPPPGAPYRVPFDPAEIRESLPREQHHRQRTFTVRGLDREEGRLTVDFVVHGDEGVAGPWAAAARPGDLVQLIGPGGGYSPAPEADWHLMAGDEAVIPAIAVSLERVPAGMPVYVVLEVEDGDDEQPLTTPGTLHLHWIHRNGEPHPAASRVLDTVRSLEFPDGRGQAFIHGEAGMVMDVRRHLLRDRAIDPADLSATGYWKYRRTDEGWRQDKPEWKRRAGLDLPGGDGA